MQLIVPGPAREAPDLRDLYDTPGPHVRAGMVQSLDGAVASGGRSRPLQAPGDLAVFRALRAVADVVLVGAGTARTEDYGPVVLSDDDRAWRSARGRAPEVPLVVVTRSLDVSPDARWLGPDALVLTCRSAADGRAAEVPAPLLVAGRDTVDLAEGLAQLRARGLSRVLCEGGPTLLGDLAGAGLLDEVCLTVSPLLAGRDAATPAGSVGRLLPATVPLRLRTLLQEQDTLLGRWEVVR